MRTTRWLWGLAVVTIASPSAAADVEPIRIEYPRAGACTDRASFETQLLARTTRARIVEHDAARTFVVRFTGSGSELTGILEVRAPTGEVLSRDVSGETCEDVIGALALVAALAIDPHASIAPLPTLVPPPPAPPPPAPPPEPPPTTRRGWRPSAGAEVGLRTATLPNVTPSAMAFGELASGAEGWLAPRARLALGGTLQQSVAASTGATSFQWLGGRADFCPVRARLSASLELSPCAGLELGALSASTENVFAGRTPTRPWVAGSALGRLRWDLSPVFVETGAEVLVPFARDRFYIGPDSTIFLVPPVGVSGWIGFGFLLFS